MQHNPLYLPENENFRAGDDNLIACANRLCKPGTMSAFFCRAGHARLLIDLKEYEIKINTAIYLLPNSIISLHSSSKDFRVSYFVCKAKFFHEVTYRMESRLFQYLKEQPCVNLSGTMTTGVDMIMRTIAYIYADRENRFRNQIAKNTITSCLLDTYDKNQRWFTQQESASNPRQRELLQKFILLVHTHCQQKRDVSFYAGLLCISTKYLTDICRRITGDPAKKIIDNFTILEIKLLLQTTTESLQNIAEQLNFPDQSYLGRFFKRHEGISPAEYRNKY